MVRYPTFSLNPPALSRLEAHKSFRAGALPLLILLREKDMVDRDGIYDIRKVWTVIKTAPKDLSICY